MVSNEDFRKALGAKADGLSDEEIEAQNILCARIAAAFFDDFKKQFEPEVGISSLESINPG